MLFNLLHLLKLFAPIFVTLAPIIIFSSFLLLWKAFSPIAVTLYVKPSFATVAGMVIFFLPEAVNFWTDTVPFLASDFVTLYERLPLVMTAFTGCGFGASGCGCGCG